MHPRTRPALAVLALTTALTLSLTACGTESGANAAAQGSGSGAPVDGGDLTFAIANDPISLNPSGTGSGNDTFYVTRQLVDSLIWQDPKDGSLKPWLATKWSANADATVFTFTLRDGVTFSDGSPFTATSVKDTFDDAVKAGALSQAASLLAGYKESKVTGKHTLEAPYRHSPAADLS